MVVVHGIFFHVHLFLHSTPTDRVCHHIKSQTLKTFGDYFKTTEVLQSLKWLIIPEVRLLPHVSCVTPGTLSQVLMFVCCVFEEKISCNFDLRGRIIRKY